MSTVPEHAGAMPAPARLGQCAVWQRLRLNAGRASHAKISPSTFDMG
jgi:hypothetical protein